MRGKLFAFTFRLTFLTYGVLHSTPGLAYDKEIKAVASVLSDNLLKGSRKTVAVVDFTDLQGNVTELGPILFT